MSKNNPYRIFARPCKRIRSYAKRGVEYDHSRWKMIGSYRNEDDMLAGMYET
jgi:hypothetical protein